jgi:RimJ/RimL family protein N-acetyltransferase
MRLRTARLRLDRVCLGDARDYCELDRDPLVMEHTLEAVNTGGIVPYWLKLLVWPNNIFQWTIRRADTGEFLGWIQIWPALDGTGMYAYRMKRAAWHQGYATEAAMAVCDYCFGTLSLLQIGAIITPENGPSRRLLLRLGLHFEGMVHAPEVNFAHVEKYLLTRQEWAEAGEKQHAAPGVARLAGAG